MTTAQSTNTDFDRKSTNRTIVEENCWLTAGDPRRAQGANKPYAPRRAGAPFWFRRIPAAAGSLLLVARARERC